MAAWPTSKPLMFLPPAFRALHRSSRQAVTNLASTYPRLVRTMKFATVGSRATATNQGLAAVFDSAVFGPELGRSGE